MVVLAGVVLHNNRMMIARRSAHKSNGGLWEFPGGKIESGESDQEGLIREFQEEFGMEIRVTDFLGTFYFSSPSLSIELRVWFAEAVTMPVHATDHDQIEWVTKDEMADYTFSPADIPAVKMIHEGNFISV